MIRASNATSALTAATIAAAAFLSPASSFTAAAQSVKAAASVDCHAIKDDTKALKCAYDDLVRRKREAEQRSEAANAITKCVQFLTQRVQDGKVSYDTVIRDAGGALNETNACPVAVKHGYDRRAQLAAPAVK